jgi:hypothetical protein
VELDYGKRARKVRNLLEISPKACRGPIIVGRSNLRPGLGDCRGCFAVYYIIGIVWIRGINSNLLNLYANTWI